jgi:hypothetical protein
MQTRRLGNSGLEVSAIGLGPNSSGISRHWLPVRNRQMTPSNCSRRCCGKGPYRPIGRNGSISSHSSSLSSRRVT